MPDYQEMPVDRHVPALELVDEAFVARVSTAIARHRRHHRILTVTLGVVCAVTFVLVSNLVIEVGTYVSGLPSTLARLSTDLSAWGAP